jgi:hypothetical protein
MRRLPGLQSDTGRSANPGDIDADTLFDFTPDDQLTARQGDRFNLAPWV